MFRRALLLCPLLIAACGSPASSPSSRGAIGPGVVPAPTILAGAPGATPTAVPPAEPIHFVAVGDTGSGAAAEMDVATAIASRCAQSGCDFGILLGDNFYPSGVTSAHDAQWDTKFQAQYGSMGFPFYAVLGNHDYGDNGAGDVFDLGLHEVEYADTHSNWIMPSNFYSFDRGAATFLALDTNLALFDFDGALAKQKSYFAGVIAASRQPWRIALGHHPYLSNGKHGNAGSYDGSVGGGANVKALFESTLCGNVDLFLSGHDHTMQLLPGTTSCPGAFVVAGSGSATTSLLGSDPTEFQKSAQGFAYITVTENEITVEMVQSATGTTLFTKTLTR